MIYFLYSVTFQGIPMYYIAEVEEHPPELYH